jgi:hypothetical protein
MNSSSNGYYERGLERATILLKKIIPKPIRLPLVAFLLTGISAWFWVSVFNLGFSPGGWTRSDRWGIHLVGAEGYVFALAITGGSVGCWIKWFRSLLKSRSGLRTNRDRTRKE